MKKIILGLVTIFFVSTIGINATKAYFSDNVTSTGNTFTTGSLDLNLDGGNTNVVKFNVSEIKPGDTQIGAWTVHNAGSIPGYLDLHGIIQTHSPGTSTKPELAVENPDIGTLGSLLNINLFIDTNNNGDQDPGETSIYNGLLKNLATDYPDLNLPLGPDSTNYITMRLNWPTSVNDNKGQEDIAQFNMNFELGQTLDQ